jgi:hypothetical protein
MARTAIEMLLFLVACGFGLLCFAEAFLVYNERV